MASESEAVVERPLEPGPEAGRSITEPSLKARCVLLSRQSSRVSLANSFKTHW